MSWPSLAWPVDTAVAPLSTVLRILGAHTTNDGTDAGLALRLVNTAQLATAGALAEPEPVVAPKAPHSQEVDPVVAAMVDERVAWPKDQVFQKRDRIRTCVGCVKQLGSFETNDSVACSVGTGSNSTGSRRPV